MLEELSFVVTKNNEYIKSIEIYSHYRKMAVTTTAVKDQGLRLKEKDAEAIAVLANGEIERLYE